MSDPETGVTHNRAAVDGDDSVRHLSGWRTVVLWPLSLVLRVWCATIRVSISREDEGHLRNPDRPKVVIFWHNRLLFTPEVYRRYMSARGMSGLVSASRDGAWLAAFFRLMGIQAVRGSSSRRSVFATRELLDRLSAGDNVAITPDGPRGPLYDFKAGAWRLAKMANAPILLVSGRYRRARRLKSWDGFYLPCPFTTVEMRVKLVAKPPVSDSHDDREGARILREMLMDITVDD